MKSDGKLSKILGALGILVVASFPALAGPDWRIEAVASGLKTPWAVAPLPEGGALITQRGGRLVFSRDGKNAAIAGGPRVVARGQGGLLDITPARDFAQSRRIYLTYAKRQSNGGSGTALGTAVFPEGAGKLRDFREIFDMKHGSSGGRHFGSRVVEALDGTLFVTIGDRGDRPSAQDRTRHNGSVVRVARDGSIPRDNPFVQGGGLPEIWSFGHRNPQGAALDLRGNLWVSEHGARGGDEINAIKRGANFGWPVISYGRHYSGRQIGEGTIKAGMEQPAFFWDPSIAPSGLLIYSGKQFPQWKGDFFVGSLKFGYISRLSGDPLREVERIETPQTGRLRDIVEAPDGTIWFISVEDGAVYRLSPS
ncbi:PQQ-dependent sugar dehydrogenase [Sulfitobacter sp. KE42]|uniref:PQQ-dependent sugar dehydrogenase n=1 Tax=Sulfitobacter sp. KE42 TaxID=2731155 RepID=UPI003F8EB4E5